MIVAALLFALAQDTLRLTPGVHAGPLILERPTVVIGNPGAVLQGHGHGTVLVIRGRGSVVRGLTIQGSGHNPDAYDAGVRISADSVTVEDVTINGAFFGVFVEHARGVVLRHLIVTGPQTGGEGDKGDGISFYDSRAILAEGNRIEGVRDGIYFSYSDSIVVQDNHVSHVRFGVHYMFSHENRFARNVFTDNAAGAVIMNSRHVTIENNVFAWNAGSRSYGLVLQTASDPNVRGNAFVGNGIGVFFDNVIRGRVTGNLIAANWLGLQLFANSEATVVIGNSVAGNTFDASGGGTPGAYALCEAGRGNYWGSASGGYDLDADGVLDVPHTASSPLAELALTREGLRPLLDSPAAQTLGWAERAVPVFASAGVVDSCPLARPPQLATVSALPSAPAAQLGGRAAQAGLSAVLVLGAGLVLVRGRGRRAWLP